jgi:hypothetical protein
MFGYPVDSGTGCFMDRAAGQLLTDAMNKSENYYETLIEEMDKSYQHTWSWLNKKFGNANLVAFSSGDGDGMYATYVGFDGEGAISAVVTDFVVLSYETDGVTPSNFKTRLRSLWEWRRG